MIDTLLAIALSMIVVSSGALIILCIGLITEMIMER